MRWVSFLKQGGAIRASAHLRARKFSLRRTVTLPVADGPPPSPSSTGVSYQAADGSPRPRTKRALPVFEPAPAPLAPPGDTRLSGRGWPRLRRRAELAARHIRCRRWRTPGAAFPLLSHIPRQAWRARPDKGGERPSSRNAPRFGRLRRRWTACLRPARALRPPATRSDGGRRGLQPRRLSQWARGPSPRGKGPGRVAQGRRGRDGACRSRPGAAALTPRSPRDTRRSTSGRPGPRPSPPPRPRGARSGSAGRSSGFPARPARGRRRGRTPSHPR